MKNAILGILAMICACGALAGRGLAAQGQEKAAATAVLTVQPVKSSYGVGEAMLLVLRLRNTGRQPIVADGRFALGSTIRVSVTDPAGNAFDWTSYFDSRVPAFQALEPGAGLTRVICLNCGVRDPFSYPFRQPGSYTLRLEFVPSALAAQVRESFPQAAPLAQPATAPPVELRVTPAPASFTAQPDEPTFPLGAPVMVHFALRNDSRQDLLAAFDLPLQGAVRVKVVDASGAEVAWSGQPADVSPLLSTLGPGTSAEADNPITPQNLFGTMMRGVAIRRPGEYTLYAVYELSLPIEVQQGYAGSPGTLVVPGPIPAPPVTFTVLPPAAPSPDNP